MIINYLQLLIEDVRQREIYRKLQTCLNMSQQYEKQKEIYQNANEADRKKIAEELVTLTRNSTRCVHRVFDYADVRPRLNATNKAVISTIYSKDEEVDKSNDPVMIDARGSYDVWKIISSMWE